MPANAASEVSSTPIHEADRDSATSPGVARLMNAGHAIDHMFLLIFATAVGSISAEFGFDRWEDLICHRPRREPLRLQFDPTRKQSRQKWVLLSRLSGRRSVVPLDPETRELALSHAFIETSSIRPDHRQVNPGTAHVI